MIFGDLDNPMSNISQMIMQTNAKPLHPEFGTSPSIYYVPHQAVVHVQTVDYKNGNALLAGTATLTDLSTGVVQTLQADAQGRFFFMHLKVGEAYSLKLDVKGYYPYFRVLYITSEYTDLGAVQLV